MSAEALPFDANAARAFGMVSAAVLAAGPTPRRRVADLMIASIAIVHRLSLYTTNPGDFAALDQLLTVVPVQRPMNGAGTPGFGRRRGEERQRRGDE